MVKNYPLVNKYLDKIVKRRRELNNPKKSRLLQIIDNSEADGLEKLLRKLGNKVGGFEKIFQILPELNSKTSPDERVDDMIAELRAAFLLDDRGFTDIVYHRKGFDFSCRKNENQYAVEVKFIRGPDFKRQKRIATNLAYKLNSSPEIRKLKDKIDEAINQLRVSGQQGIAIIVTNNLEVDKFWFGDEIERFRKEKEKKSNAKIYIVTNGDIYG